MRCISIFCDLTFGLGEKLAGSNTGVLRNWEVFFNHNKMVSDTCKVKDKSIRLIAIITS